jgi:hypothetical protein
MLTITSLISLALCVSASALWAKTIHRSGDFTHALKTPYGPLVTFCIESIDGEIVILRTSPHVQATLGGEDARSSFSLTFEHDNPDAAFDMDFGTMVAAYIQDKGHVLRAFGFLSTHNPTRSEIGLMLPHWFLLVVFLLLPTWRLALGIRDYRRKHGDRCISCGYDLRVSTGRCPECGTPIPAGAEGAP